MTSRTRRHPIYRIDKTRVNNQVRAAYCTTVQVAVMQRNFREHARHAAVKATDRNDVKVISGSET